MSNDEKHKEPDSGGSGHNPPPRDEEIRDKVRDLTAQTLKSGHIDTDGVREVTQAFTAGMSLGGKAGVSSTESFADALKVADEALVKSAESAHLALQQLATRGSDFSDNDVKEALERLGTLQRDYAAVVTQVTDAASGNLQREFRELAVHAQHVGVDTGARLASLMNEFASGLTTTYRENTQAGLDATSEYGMRFASLASGVLAGVAEALRERSPSNKSE